MEKTIAEKFLNQTTSRFGTDHYMFLISELDRLDYPKDQDWDAETTTYTFPDGSEIVDQNGDLRIGRKNDK